MGHVIPLMIALAAMGDAGSRFLPLAWFSKRLDEPSRRYSTGFGGLTPGFHYDKSHAYGDSADFTGSRSLRFYRREWMRVDKDGFRLDGVKATRGRPPQYVLFGDSFANGVSLSDDATLSAQFNRFTGGTLFNPSLRLDWGRVRRTIDYLGMTKGTVIVEIMDRLPLPGVEDFQDRPVPDTLWRRLRHRRDVLWDGYCEASPLQIVSEHLVRRLQNDHLLPNPIAYRTKVETLLDGRKFVFLDADIATLGSPIQGNANGLLMLKDRLNRRGLKLFVVLVPDKYQVYHRLITNPPPEPVGLSRIRSDEIALHKAGIDVLNLEPVFESAAKAALQRGEILYWPDDTHWNPLGVRLAAQTLAKKLSKSSAILNHRFK